VEDLIAELDGLPKTANVVVIEHGNRRAIPLDIIDVDYAAGQVTLGVDAEVLKP
jgi:hypothetical protein